MNSSMLVINIISSYSGGGAEFLVRSVDRHIQSSFYDNETLYFNKDSLDKVNFCKSEQELSISSRNFLAIFKIRKYLISKLKTHDCIVLHAHLTWPLFYVAIASLGLNLHLIYTEHSTFNKRRNYPYLKFIDRWAYSRYEKIIGISKATSTSLLNWLGTRYQNKIITIENGAELSQFTPRENLPTDRKLKLLSVGSLKHLKGFETTIRSLQAVKDIVSSYTIVGSGPDLDRLQNLAKECGVDDIIHFAGWSDNPESFYQDADVLLIPSHWEGLDLLPLKDCQQVYPLLLQMFQV